MKIPQRLSEGYRAFIDDRFPIERSRYQKLAETGQRPETMVIGCCDSRVSPEVIFDAHPGELFVVRNVANLAPPYAPTGFTHGVSGALEYAVQLLKVKTIIVLGHTHCGGIRAYIEHRNRLEPGDFIDNWISLISPAAKAAEPSDVDTQADFPARLEQASIVVTLGNLMTFPWIPSQVELRELQLIGAYFDVVTGSLSVYEPSTGKFKFLDDFNGLQTPGRDDADGGTQD